MRPIFIHFKPHQSCRKSLLHWDLRLYRAPCQRHVHVHLLKYAKHGCKMFIYLFYSFRQQITLQKTMIHQTGALQSPSLQKIQVTRVQLKLFDKFQCERERKKSHHQIRLKRFFFISSMSLPICCEKFVKSQDDNFELAIFD